MEITLYLVGCFLLIAVAGAVDVARQRHQCHGRLPEDIQ